MVKRAFKQTLFMLMALLIIVASLPMSVFAEESESSGSSSSEKTSNMISFFQKERTSISADTVSPDEYVVYSVFISNFFIPWKTKLSDLKSEDDNGLSAKVSEKFFGSSGNKGEVAKINNKVYSAIKGGLKETDGNFGIYATTKSEKPITGANLLKKFSGDYDNKKLYLKGGEEFLDLSNSSVHSAFQILFGISPDMMLDSKGLRSMKGLYVDGVGNIWGKPKGNSEPDDYILIMPSALDPATFATDGKGYKLPMANVFAMGASLKVKTDYLSNANKIEAYYNLVGHIGSSKYNKGIVNIIGISSPFNKIGDSNSLIKNGASSNPNNELKKFIKEDAEDNVDDTKTKLLLTVNASRVSSGALKAVEKNDNIKSKTSKSKLINYFFATNVVALKDVADEMYFFKNPNASSQASVGDGDFTKKESLVVTSHMFTDSDAKLGDSNAKYNLYDGSYYVSPFAKLVKAYRGKKSNEEKQDYLYGKLNKKLKKDSDAFKQLQKFLETGEWTTNDTKVIGKAMEALSKSAGFDPAVLAMLPSSKVGALINTTSKLWIIKNVKTSVPGLTADDDILSYETLAAETRQGNSLKDFWSWNKDFFKNSKYEDTFMTPYALTNYGGTLYTGSADMKDKEKHGVATLFWSSTVYRYFGMNTTFANALSGQETGTKVKSSVGGESYNLGTAIMDGTNNYAGIYWGYMVSLLHVSPSGEDDDSWGDIESYSNAHLPDMEFDTIGGDLDLNAGSNGVSESSDKTLLEMQKDIVKQVYQLLNPDDSTYRMSLIKAAEDSWVLELHRSITGSWVENSYSVSKGSNNTYSSVVGYINTPSLSDLPLTDWILDDYVYVYMVLMLILLITLICMALVGARTVGESLLVFLLGAVILILPQYLVSGVITASNNAGDAIYSDKFDYWAITQHQQSLKTLKKAQASNNDLDVLIASNMQSAKDTYSNDASVRLKWMSPKKEDYFDSLFGSSASQGLKQNSTLFRWLFNAQFNQEEYVYDDPLATYVYRPYNAIAGNAKANYNSASEKTVDKDSVFEEVTNRAKSMTAISENRFDLFNSNYVSPVRYSNDTIETIKSAEAFGSKSDTNDDSYRYWVANNTDLLDAIFREDYSSSPGYTGSDSSDPYYENFSLLTESPFYYFYDVIRSRYASNDGKFKDALLTEQLFKVSQSETDDSSIWGKKRDYLDMQGLFSYVVPTLAQSNDYVDGYISKYGSSISSFDFEKGEAGKSDKVSELFNADKEHKENMKNVWKMYTPWVSELYTLDAMNAKGYVANKRVTFEDALNPATYTKQGRDMIFSEADMYAKNYKQSDLTNIEYRIQEAYNDITEDWYYLANYYDFDDEALISAAAMTATFDFNKAFSETRFVGESTTMYPQGYELKNFNYDAFMRLMLINATGEPLTDPTTDDDLYARVLSKTSFFSGILLILCDVFGVFIIPALKVVALLLMLFLGIATSIATLLSPPERIVKSILKNLGLPVALFFVTSVSFAWIIAYFMGDGLSGYVGSSTPTLGITDPTITMLLMLIADIVYAYILWKIVKFLLNGFRTQATTAFFSSVGTVVSAGAVLAGTAVGALKRRATRKDVSSMSETLESMRDSMSRGTGGSGSAGGPGSTVGSPIESPASTNTAPSNSSGTPSRSGGSGGSGGSGSSGEAKDKSNVIQFPNQKTKAQDEDSKSFADKIDKLSSFRRHPIESGRLAKRKLGHKMIDFKYGVRGAKDKTVDKAKATGEKISKGYNYIRDVDRVNKDVRKIAKSGVEATGKGINKGYEKTQDFVLGGKDKLQAKKDKLVAEAKGAHYDAKLDRIDYETAKLREMIETSEPNTRKTHNAEVKIKNLAERRNSINALQEKLRK